MKVLFQGRPEVLKNGGGDKIQIENTARELEKLGVKIDIIPDLGVDPSAYDIVHIFQLDWISETYFHAKKAKEHLKPLVVSPIHHKNADVKKFDDIYTFDFRRFSSILFRNQFQRDTLKNIYRSFFNPLKIKPTLVSTVKGLKNMHQDILNWSDMVLVQTSKEAEDLKELYGVDFKWVKVPNGVGDNFIKHIKYENKLGFENYILCVGRVEPRKNQLKIIQAVKEFRNEKNIDLNLLFIGSKNRKHHLEYTYYFDREVNKNQWIKHIDHIPYQDIPGYYQHAKVCVSASWFETTGLTSLEALISGTNAVASGERAKEYLGDYASYCEPDSIESIKTAIIKEYYASRPRISEDLKNEYTWQNAAQKTLNVYNELLSLKR